jgi:glycosyltransferase involved in cell wall biosynthesis
VKTNCSEIVKDNRFAVLMAVYFKDDSILLKMALDSVYANTLKPDIVVLVQDGPVGEDISSIIKSFQARNDFNLIKLPVNKGLANALNFGLKHISTPYIFRADSDDYNLPQRFEKQIAALNLGYDLVGASIMEVSKDGKPIAIRRLPTSRNSIIKTISRRNPFNHMTVAFRRSAVLHAGGYPDIFLKEDYALWASMLNKGAKVINIDEVLVHATAGPDMYRRRGGIKYVRSEMHMQFFLIRHGFQSVLGAVFIGLARSLIFLMPTAFRGFFYERFLRKSI